MNYDNITAIKVLHLIAHFAYLIKTIPEFDPGTKFEFDVPFNYRLAKQFDDVKGLQDILDVSDIDLLRNILSVETKTNYPFARILFTDGFSIEELLSIYPELKLPNCEVCGNEGYHIPGSGACYATDFSHQFTECECECK